MKIALFSSDFSAAQLRLQPWLTLAEVGRRFQAAGHEVVVATDAREPGALPLPVQRFPSLAGTESRAISDWIRSYAPDRSIVSVSPFSLATASWHGALNPATNWAFLPYAMYNGAEMRAAWAHLKRADRWGFGRNLLVPSPLWRASLRRRFVGVICQSHRTAQRLGKNMAAAVIPPGIELDRWQPAAEPAHATTAMRPFVFVGSPKAIRGFDVLLRAFASLPPSARLRILARGLEPAAEGPLRARLALLGIADRVTLVGGWMSAADLVAEIQQAAAVVLPFVLVPSEIPVSVMEVVACGTPVVTTDIDGLPEAVGEAGVIVPPGDAQALSAALAGLIHAPQRLMSLRAACLKRRADYTDWNQAAADWAHLLSLEMSSKGIAS